LCHPAICHRETDKERDTTVIASQLNLDHRLAELRPSEDDQRVARELRKAASPATRPARST